MPHGAGGNPPSHGSRLITRKRINIAYKEEDVRSIISLMVLLLGLSACGNDAAPADGGTTPSDNTIVLTAADAGLDLEVTVGDTIQVVLEGNPSTGYGWEVESIDESVLQMAGEAEFTSDTDLVGAPGTFTFTFEAVGEGETSLGLVYRRPWEDAEPADTFGVTITAVA
jgi:inhibitor of cysteine peptidase